jgi:hypothetical protein
MLRGFGLVLVAGAFDELAVEEQGPGADQGDRAFQSTADEQHA